MASDKRKIARIRERQLLAACIAGDQQASDMFVRQYSDLVYRTVQYTLLNRNVRFTTMDLEDLHNTVFINLFDKRCHKLRQFKGKNGCSVATWIRIITVRLVLNAIRRKGVDSITGQVLRVPIEDFTELESSQTETWQLMEKAEQESLIQKGISNLAPRDRLFMNLHFNQGFTIKEIAETMQLSVDNIYTIKHRAIKRLKSYVMKE
jgi:RNA polymerase sigma factor (sigma-70 family)